MMGTVFAQGAQWIRADFHLHTRADREFMFTGNDNSYNSNYVDALENAGKLLPYRGLGSGLLRALRAWPQIELIDDRAGNLFKVIVTRPQEQAA